MAKRNFRTLEEFKAHIHREGTTLVEFSQYQGALHSNESEKI